ncbi:MAG: hypothetical protein SFV18_12480 [Bryobacteraceae bacterium]|nr:hypothetical protein [Bryobacteraceae bacterium]
MQDQISHFANETWFEQETVTFGPALSGSTTRKLALRHFERAVAELISKDLLDRLSPLAVELRAVLGKPVASKEWTLPRPRTPVEESLYHAFEAVIRFTDPEPEEHRQ